MKILITGSTGFLGSALVTGFSKDESNQLILPIRSKSESRKLKKYPNNCLIEFYNETSEIEEIVFKANPNVIIHTACSYGRKGESILQMLDVNIKLGLSILQAIKRSKNEAVFINSGTVLSKDINLYSLSKNNFAEWGRMISSHSEGKIKFVDVLLQHIYGPFDDATKFPTYIIRSCINNTPEIDLTDGLQMRDFIYIDDVVRAYRLIIDRMDEFDDQTTIDIGSGKALKVREFVETVHAITKSKTKLNFGSILGREDENLLYQADIGRMQTLGWEPRFNLEQGLREIIKREFDK